MKRPRNMNHTDVVTYAHEGYEFYTYQWLWSYGTRNASYVCEVYRDGAFVLSTSHWNRVDACDAAAAALPARTRYDRQIG